MFHDPCGATCKSVQPRPPGMDLGTLNPDQRRAVLQIDGPVLVLAGAGSGKTRVITHRIAYMLKQGIPPDTIVALSFTNKAADEMRERLCKMVGKQAASELALGTFHSLGARMIRERHADFDLPQRFSILDQGDVYGLVRSSLRDAGIHGGERRYDLGAITQRISLWKNDFITPQQALEPARHDSEYDEVAAMVYEPYQDRLAALGAVDFDDLVCRVAEVLRDDPDALAYWQNRFHYLMVDEYQDTNQAQFEVLSQLAGTRENLFVVGDDDQAIYGWRGAKVTNILGFDLYFPDTQVIKLEQNYRSCPPVTTCANHLIVRNYKRHDKVLRPQRTGGEPVREVVAADGAGEARWVGRKIRNLIHEERFSPRDIAVLYRSSKQAQAIEESLQEHGIEYQVLGGQTFYDQKQLKDVLAYFKVLVTPRDDQAVRRALDVPSRGVGAKTVAKLVAYAQEHQLSLLDAVHRSDDLPGLQARTRRGLHEFSNVLRRGQGRRRVSHSAVAGLREILDAVGFRSHMAKETGSNKAAASRWANIEFLFRSLERFENRAESASPKWSDFLNRYDLRRDKEQEAEPTPKVTLATLHSSKGLEWPVVFIIGCEEGIMPHKRVDSPRISDAIAGDEEEERRLFYVGITRARDRLYLTRAEARIERGRQVERRSSRFLRELPEGVCEVYDVGREEAISGERMQSLADAFLAKLAAQAT